MKEKELQKENDRQNENKKSPLWIIMAPVLALLIIVMIVPYYSVKLDPTPKRIMQLSSIDVSYFNATHHNITINQKKDYKKLLNPENPNIKMTADKIATYGCEGNRVCYAKAIFFFVRDNFEYVSDPYKYEYVKTAEESLVTGGGDCDDAAVLLANLMQAIGIETRFVFIPGHVYLQIKLDEALSKYKDNGWINLDPTCKSCDFGEVPYSVAMSDKVFVQ